MLLVFIGITAILFFISGFFLALAWFKKSSNTEVSGNRTVQSITEPEDTGEQTRKVELVDIKDLLNLDGEVIDAEPAPTVSEDKLHKAELEIERLNFEIKKLQGREQSKEIALAQLRKRFEDSGPMNSAQEDSGPIADAEKR